MGLYCSGALCTDVGVLIPCRIEANTRLAQSGRFETQTKICLSISSYHPEHWQPSWSMRTALTALIAFFPAPADSAIGSLETSPEERKRLAAESRWEPVACIVACT